MKKTIGITLKIIVGIYLAIVLYLFVLNGRYERLGDWGYIDKWKKEVILIGADELPIKENGQIQKR
jgi:hypothetical protein